MSALKVLLYLIGLFSLCNALEQKVPVIRRNITTFADPDGSITGVIIPGFHQTKYIDGFLGVPFAKAPIGELRFSNPEPFPDFWTIDHQADVEKDMCLQRNTLESPVTIQGDEDCLYLNVFRQHREGWDWDQLLPVIIYFHGGGFIGGSPSTSLYGPKYFMDQGEVILVTAAYRLGTFGFLSTGDEEIPGNFAFKDQALAMQWVKDNIFFFNGDPDQITIMGQSAGGASVHLHMFSPLSDGLFNRVASMSGTGLAPFANVNSDPLSLARLLAEEIGIVDSDTIPTDELAAALKTADSHDILEASNIFVEWLDDPLVVFGPVVESSGTNNPNPFLIEDPRTSITNGEFKQCPLLMTFVPEEGVVRSGGLLKNDANLELLNDNFDLAIRVLNSFSPDDPDLQDKIGKVNSFYFDDTGNIDIDSNGDRLTDMFSDRMFHYPFYSAYKFHSKSVDPLVNPLYLMEFNYRGPYSFSQIYSGTDDDFGVVHGDDLLYLMDNVLDLFDVDSAEAELIKEMVNIYVNFASGELPHTLSTVCTFDSANEDDPCERLQIVKSAAGNGYEVSTTDETDMGVINFWRGIELLF